MSDISIAKPGLLWQLSPPCSCIQRGFGAPVEILRETDGVRYSLREPSDLDEMALILADAFSNYEPMARAAGCSGS